MGVCPPPNHTRLYKSLVAAPTCVSWPSTLVFVIQVVHRQTLWRQNCTRSTTDTGILTTRSSTLCSFLCLGVIHAHRVVKTPRIYPHLAYLMMCSDVGATCCNTSDV